MKIRRKAKLSQPQKIQVMKVGPHRKWVIFLWILLISSVAFGIYKNFTGINRHTVHETRVIKEQVVDTNAIENFVKNFAQVYYSWENNQKAIDERAEALQGYLTKALQDLNDDTIRPDIPTSSSVRSVDIWKVRRIDDHEYTVIFSVNQWITESKKRKTVEASYEVTVYVDQAGNLVIIQNPTICGLPAKSAYEPKAADSDSNVDEEATTGEVTAFLKTFFKLYPTANESELAYYVKENALKPVGKKYVFSELINPVYQKKGKQIQVSVSVKYLDQQTKAIQVSQFNLTLEKNRNWMIVK
ncbi:conjugal transfer protein [Sporolactobacillus shoreicorticis]|uniref:Conjugal transfer protein n=1 Tax=Sporolactobacillus shoreicorticis TaxID=1923877 RepID=A0ABW5S844_9BACL|nr:conjugal transfer protein [Sporolactobacillus shoreicorticis]MCO7126048.1 conjugal transfer protein [Sporolactobacillus shoreicorticis]